MAARRADDSALRLPARHVLAGPIDEGRASYQAELTVWKRCQRAQQLAQGEALDVATEVAAMARCDGQQLASTNFNDTHVGANCDNEATDENVAGRKHQRSPLAKQDVPPAVRRQLLRRDRHRCQVPGCSHANFVDVHHVVPRPDLDPEVLNDGSLPRELALPPGSELRSMTDRRASAPQAPAWVGG